MTEGSPVKADGKGLVGNEEASLGSQRNRLLQSRQTWSVCVRVCPVVPMSHCGEHLSE